MKLVIIAGLVVIIDQITKAIILDTLPLYHSVSVIQGFFNFTHVHNPGGAFGFLADQCASVRSIFFIVVPSLVICLILYLYKNTYKTYPFLATALALILGGAIGNLIDRVRFGKVVDFLDLHVGNMHWPTFNVADSAISVGMVIFIFYLLFNRCKI